jgi:hypothetical protein
MHPLINDMSTLKDTEIESIIYDLTKKYFITTNLDVKSQLLMILDSYKAEHAKRQHEAWQNLIETRNKGLDKLINIE